MCVLRRTLRIIWNAIRGKIVFAKRLLEFAELLGHSQKPKLRDHQKAIVNARFDDPIIVAESGDEQ